MKRVKSTCIRTRAGNRQFVCNNNFEATAEQHRDKKTKQDQHMVRFDCDGDASTSCGGCEEGKGETQVRSESGSDDTEGCKKDPNFGGIWPSSSVEREPLCEMASESTPMPQPLVVDCGAVETVILRTWFPKPQDSRIRRVQARCFPHDDRRQHCGKRRRENSDHVQSRRSTIGGSDRPSGNVNEALGSVSKMVRNGHSVEFETSGSYTENMMTRDVLWLPERDGVFSLWT